MLKRMLMLAVVFALSMGLVFHEASAQIYSPHRFYGSVTLDEATAAKGTSISAQINGVIVASTVVSGGQYDLIVEETATSGAYSGKTVTFTVGGFSATESAPFTPFKVESLPLTASADRVAASLQSISGKYRSIWGYEAAIQRWRVYTPDAPAASDLTRLTVGDGYYIYITEPTILVTSVFSKQLYVGWNLIGWLGP